MGDKPAKIKMDKFEEPPEGEDWLWWHPDEPDPSARVGYLGRFQCDRCDVKWEQEVCHNTKHVRCFCCGQFKRKPKI